MLRRSFVIGSAFASAGAAAAAAPSIHMQRGINLFPWLCDLNGGQFAWSPSSPGPWPDDLRRLRAAGFDFVRLPINTTPLLGPQAPEGLKTIAAAATLVLQSGLTLILDLHPQEGGALGTKEILSTYPSGSLFQSYRSAVLNLASIAVSLRSPNVILELLNEPLFSAGGWRPIIADLIGAVRGRAPNLEIMIPAVSNDSRAALLASAPSSDPHIYYTFHYYDPSTFTHQGATWVPFWKGEQYINGLPWPPSRGDAKSAFAKFKNSISNANINDPIIISSGQKRLSDYFNSQQGPQIINRDFASVSAWAARNGVDRRRIVLGEFGVLKTEGRWHGANVGDAAAWIGAVRAAAERNGFPWAMWAYTAGMSFADGPQRQWHPEIAQALGVMVR